MFTFFKEFLKDYRAIGAVLPSSKILAKAMVCNINFATATVIIEYGAGTGVFTREILKRKRSETHFLIIERNEYFYRKICLFAKEFSNTTVILGDASAIQEYCEENGVVSVDYIISGLPFSSLPKRVSTAILRNTKKVLGEGLFITFQYSRVNEHMLSTFFPSVDSRLVLRNIPPAYVFTCRENK